MSETRVFIGRLTYKAREEDVRRFFKGFGKIIEISLKTGYGFVEFENSEDADDAVSELNNEDLLGERVTVEHVKRLPRSSSSSYRSYSSSSRQDYGRYNNRFQSRYSRGSFRPNNYQRGPVGRYAPPKQTRYRVVVHNLSSRVCWRELKGYVCEAAEVTFADAHKIRQNEGVVCFETYSGMKRAIKQMDNKKINGRRIRLVPDRSWSRSRSTSRKRSRSRSRYSSRSKSRSRSRSRSRSYSKSVSRSRSRSRHHSKTRGHSRSRSSSRASSRRSISRSRSRARSSSSDNRKKYSKDDLKHENKSDVEEQDQGDTELDRK